MAYEHNEGSGTIFTNRHRKNEKQPQWRGEFKLNGKMYEIAMWEKQGQAGTFYSVKVQEPQPKEQPADYAKGSRSPHNPKMSADFDDDFGDEIPFN